MLVQFKDSALIKPQSFPDGIATLDGRIERAHASLIAMHQLTVDVDDQITVSFVKLLQHGKEEDELGKQEKKIQSETCGLFSFPAFLIILSVTPSKCRATDQATVRRPPDCRAGCAGAPRPSVATTSKSVASTK